MPIFRTTKFSKVFYSGQRPGVFQGTPCLEETLQQDDKSVADWTKCSACNAPVQRSDLAENLAICPKCDYHHPLTADERIAILCDEDSFQAIDETMTSVNPLAFSGYEKSYQSKRSQTGLNDAVVSGFGNIEGQTVGIAVMDFRFMGASMGAVVGEKITRLVESSTERGLPILLVCASGGARMHEGCLSLMQMAKTSGALARHSARNLPMICLLTNPTYGGVTASFASLGDVILAEPKALIGFAGGRVIQSTIKCELPDNFQTAEFLVEHGLVDRIVHRRQLREELATLLGYLVPAST